MVNTASDDRRRLATTAAVFWFEAIGAIFVIALVVLSPLSCFGDSFDGGEPCPAGPVPLLLGGSLIPWAAMIAGVAPVAIAGWLATRSRPITRAVIFSMLGLLAAVPVILVAAGGGLFAVLPFLWTGIPAVLLLGSWLPVLAAARRGRVPAAAHVDGSDRMT